MADEILLLQSRIINSFLTFPGLVDWLWTTVIFGCFCAVIIPFEMRLRFLKLKHPSIPLLRKTKIVLFTLFFPAVSEEIIFRVLILPRQDESASIQDCLFWVVAGVLVFVIYHPVNAALFMRKAKSTFNSFAFLISSAILGLACSGIYLKTGSIYTTVAAHWICVVGWLLFFGGYEKLNRDIPEF